MSLSITRAHLFPFFHSHHHHQSICYQQHWSFLWRTPTSHFSWFTIGSQFICVFRFLFIIIECAVFNENILIFLLFHPMRVWFFLSLAVLTWILKGDIDWKNWSEETIGCSIVESMNKTKNHNRITRKWLHQIDQLRCVR